MPSDVQGISQRLPYRSALPIHTKLLSEVAAESRGGTVKRGKRKEKHRLGRLFGVGLRRRCRCRKEEQDSSLIAQESEIPECERGLVMEKINRRDQLSGLLRAMVSPAQGR
jgi:hypothetical protein